MTIAPQVCSSVSPYFRISVFLYFRIPYRFTMSSHSTNTSDRRRLMQVDREFGGRGHSPKSMNPYSCISVFLDFRIPVFPYFRIDILACWSHPQPIECLKALCLDRPSKRLCLSREYDSRRARYGEIVSCGVTFNYNKLQQSAEQKITLPNLHSNQCVNDWKFVLYGTSEVHESVKTIRISTHKNVAAYWESCWLRRVGDAIREQFGWITSAFRVISKISIRSARTNNGLNNKCSPPWRSGILSAAHAVGSANIVRLLGSWFTSYSLKSVFCDVFSDARNVVDTLTARSNENGNRTSMR